jgi:hypothetical protein
MHHLKWAARFLLASLSLLFALGCGDSRPAVDRSTTEAKVSGMVKFQGKAVSGGKITFNPSNIERQMGEFTATIGPDGTYSLTTLTGVNAVRFSGQFLVGRPDVAMRIKIVEVAQGDNARDFDILGTNDLAEGPTYPERTRAGGSGRASVTQRPTYPIGTRAYSKRP